MVSGGGIDGKNKFADGSLSIADAVAVDGAILHQKHKFCFCCCDYRRAVMVIDAIALIGLLMNLPAVLLMRSSGAINIFGLVTIIAGAACYTAGIYGAKTYQPWGVVLAAIPHSINILSQCYLIFALFAFPDAYKGLGSFYGDMMADASDGDLTADDAADAFYGGMLIGAVGGLILGGFYFHAHLKLRKLMKQGIITPRNYPNVSSCCCD